MIAPLQSAGFSGDIPGGLCHVGSATQTESSTELTLVVVLVLVCGNAGAKFILDRRKYGSRSIVRHRKLIGIVCRNRRLKDRPVIITCIICRFICGQ